MSFLNFEDIKASNPIADVATKLGLNLTKSGASFRGKCPSCESSGDRNLAITPEKNLYFCFTHGKGGDQLQLVSHVLGIPTKEAAQYLAGQPSKDTSKEKMKGEKPSVGFAPLDYLISDHPAVVALGIEPGDADRMGIGFAERGLMKGLVAVPIRLTDGRLVGYLGLTEAKVPSSWKW